MLPHPDAHGETRLPINSAKTVVLANFDLPPGTKWEDIKDYLVKANDLMPVPM